MKCSSVGVCRQDLEIQPVLEALGAVAVSARAVAVEPLALSVKGAISSRDWKEYPDTAGSGARMIPALRPAASFASSSSRLRLVSTCL